jgi:hypothetical protein
LVQPRTLWQEGVTTLTCIDMLQCDRQNCAADHPSLFQKRRIKQESSQRRMK